MDSFQPFPPPMWASISSPLPSSYTQPYRTHKLRDTGRSVVHSNVVALLGDFAGGPPAIPGTGLGSGNDFDGGMSSSSSSSSSIGRTGGRYRKRSSSSSSSSSAASSADESMLAGVGSPSVGRGRGKLATAKLLSSLAAASHNETLSSFP